MTGIVVGLLFASGVLLIWLAVAFPRVETRSAPSRLRQMLVDAQLGKVRPAVFIVIVGALGLLSGATVLIVTTGLVVSLFAALAGGVVPALWVRRRSLRTRERVAGSWPDVVDNLLAGIRSGLPLAEAVEELADTGPDVTRPGFGSFRRALHVTGRIDDALDAMKAHFADPVADRIAEALRVAKDVGGHDIGAILRTLSANLRMEQRTRGELLARQSWTVNGARLAAAAPWIILLLLCTRPENAQAFDSASGGLLLAVGVIVSVLAHHLMVRIGRLPAEQRSLA